VFASWCFSLLPERYAGVLGSDKRNRALAQRRWVCPECLLDGSCGLERTVEPRRGAQGETSLTTSAPSRLKPWHRLSDAAACAVCLRAVLPCLGCFPYLGRYLREFRLTSEMGLGKQQKADKRAASHCEPTRYQERSGLPFAPAKSFRPPLTEYSSQGRKARRGSACQE
jgi:hypothetical protein